MHHEAFKMRTRTYTKNLGAGITGAVLEYFDFSVSIFVAAATAWNFSRSVLRRLRNLQHRVSGPTAAGIIIAHYAERIGRKKMFPHRAAHIGSDIRLFPPTPL